MSSLDLEAAWHLSRCPRVTELEVLSTIDVDLRQQLHWYSGTLIAMQAQQP